MKDFFDIWSLKKQMPFKGATLKKAIENIFSQRKTMLNGSYFQLLEQLKNDPTKEQQWNHFVKRTKVTSPGFAIIIDEIAEFLGPVIESIIEDKSDTPSQWIPPSTWS